MATPAPDELFLALQSALSGRYSLERELGRGGMGVVYLAREVRLDRPVAIKLLPPMLAADAMLRDRFLREARLAARLSHPNIVPIHSVDEVAGFVFYVMAYVEGETLAQRVDRRGPLSPPEATRVLQEIAWALAYAHSQGIIHRDIKPANILLERGRGRAMVADFGIARIAHAPLETAAEEVIGTPEYMSPEQARGESVDGRSDLYALGLVGHFALTGAPPFRAGTALGVLAMQVGKEAPSLTASGRAIPRSLALVLERCLKKDPFERFERGEALAEALDAGSGRSADVPAAVRSFLAPGPRLLTVLSAYLGFVLSAVTLGSMRTLPIGAFGSTVVAIIAIIVATAAPPIVLTVSRMRRLLRSGYGRDDVIAGLRWNLDRRREESLFETGPWSKLRERMVRAVAAAPAIAAMVLLVAGAALSMLGRVDLRLGSLGLQIGVGSLYTAIIAGLIARLWVRSRESAGDTPGMRFWRGWPGRVITKLASIGLAGRSVALDRPTELAIASSAEELYARLRKDVREELAGVPRVLRSLEERAHAARSKIRETDEAIAAARPGDHRAARAAAEAQLADIVAALENLRLDLLRVRARPTDAHGISRDLDAARAAGDEVDRLLAKREIAPPSRDE